jgi:hypothetical protein
MVKDTIIEEKNGFIYRGQLTSETRTADWRN